MLCAMPVRCDATRHATRDAQVGTGVQSASVQAIYLDDQMSGWSILNNTFSDCQVGLHA